MKKFTLLAISATIMTGLLQAQKTRLGVQIGTTFSNYKVKVESASMTSKLRMGYTVGLVAEIPSSKHLTVMPALNYVQKGGRFKNEYGKDVLVTHYVELPLNLLYRGEAGKGHVLVGGGPSISAGLWGKDKWESQGEKGSDKIKFGSGEDKDLEIIDAGLNFMAAYRTPEGLIISANYYAGLSNLAPGSDYGGKIHNRYFGVRVGYLISR